MAANRKEWEMLFSLNAQLGGSYTSTFSSAQQQIISLQNEINSLSSLQSDISAFEKQQQAVEATRSKLETLQQQYQNIETEIQNTEGFSASLENQLLSKQQQIDRTSQSLENQTAKLDQMGTALEDAGIDTDNLRGESERLEKEMEEVKDAQEEVADSAQDMGDAGTQAISDMRDILASAGITKALQEITAAFQACMDVAAGFEATMSTVEALSGATAEEMDQLTACAKELGSTTAYTAQQSAEAMTYMAMAGWDTQDMLAGMSGIMNLAAASGEDLAQVSDIVTDALTAFGLEASDTAHFADVLAATATNANTTVEDMGEAFKNVAPICGTLGYSIDDVSTLMGLMADNGTKGAQAGTALKNTLNGLVSGVTLTSDALGDYEYSAINADGTTKELNVVIDELREAFKDMTAQEKISNAQTIAGNRTYSGLLAILNATDDEYQSMTESIKDCTGAASEMAEIKLDNTTGSLTIMKSAWEGLQITIGEQLNPAMSNLYDMMAGVFNWINAFIEANPGIIKMLSALVVGVGAFSAALVAYTVVTKLAKAAQEALNKAMEANPYVMVASALVALTAAVASFVVLARDTTTEQYKLKQETKELTQELKDQKDAYDELTDSIDDEAGNTSDLIDEMADLLGISDRSAAEQARLQSIIDALNEAIPDLGLAYDAETDSINMTTEAVRDLADAQADSDRYYAAVDRMNELYEDQATIQEKLDRANAELAIAQDEYNTALEQSTDGTMLYNGALVNAQQRLGNAQQAQQTLTEELEANQAELAEAQAAVDEYSDVIEEAAAEAEALAAQQEELDNQVEMFNGTIEDTLSQIEALTEAYQDAYNSAYQSISGQYDLWDEAAEVTAISADTINKNLQGQIDYWSDYNANLEALGERTDDIEGLGDVIASFADGSEESVNAVAGLAEALAEGNDEALSEMVSKYQELQEQQVTVSDSIAQMVTDYTEQMQALVDQLGEDIESMNLSDEAIEASRETLQAYIDGAEEMEPLVQQAYQAVAQMANNELDGIRKTLSISMSTSASGVSISTKAYAGGTGSAAPGLAIVGENGPELVNFGGGEQVIPNEETRALLQIAKDSDIAAYADGAGDAAALVSMMPEFMALFSSAGVADTVPTTAAETAIVNDSHDVTVNMPLTISVSGNATPEVVQQLQDCGESLRDQIVDILEEIEEDNARSRYA